jgi:hypothetical protein
MSFKHKPTLDKEEYGYQKINKIIKLTFGYPYSNDILEQIDFLTKRIMMPFIEKYDIPKFEKVLLSEGIKRDLGATILAIVSETIDTPHWELSYDKINPSTLFKTNKEYERGIQKMVQKIKAGLPEEIIKDNNKNTLLTIKLTLALNNEMCNKKKSLEKEMLIKIKCSDVLLAHVIWGPDNEEKLEKIKEVKEISKKIVDKVKSYYPELNNENNFFADFIYNQLCDNIINTTVEVFKTTLKDMSGTEKAKMIIPQIKECPALMITPSQLHSEIDKYIDKIHTICINPYIYEIANGIKMSLIEEGVIEEDDMPNTPEMIKLFGTFKVSVINLKTAIVDTILADVNMSEKVRTKQVIFDSPILNEKLSNNRLNTDEYTL